jgi:hypothetical protein
MFSLEAGPHSLLPSRFDSTRVYSGHPSSVAAEYVGPRGPQCIDDSTRWRRHRDGQARAVDALHGKGRRHRVNVQPKEQAALKNVKAVNPDGYEAYLMGRYFWNKRTADGLKKAKDYFDEAVAKGQDYGPAYSGWLTPTRCLEIGSAKRWPPGRRFPRRNRGAHHCMHGI